MANKLILTIALMTFTCIVNSQISFFKTYGENGYDFGYGVVQLPDSSYVITGASSSFHEGPSRAFMLKVDSTGKYIHSRSFGGDNSDIGRRIFHRENEGFWIAGYSNSFSTNADFDFYLIKTDESGELEWEKTYGTSDWERLWDAILLPDNGLIMVGETVGLASQEEDIYMVRTDATGDTLWTKRIETNLEDRAYSIVLQNDTTFLIGGIKGNDNLTKGFISAFHINGNIIWENELDSQNKSFISQVEVFGNEIYAVGSNVSTLNQNRPWIVRMDENGELIDEIIENHRPNDYYNHSAIKDADNFFISALSQVSGEFTELLLYKWHIFLYFNGLNYQLPIYDTHICHQMIVTNDNGIVYLGEIADPSFSKGGSHVSFLKIGPNDEIVESPEEILPILTITEIKNMATIIPYPNPFTNKIHFKSSDDNKKQPYVLTDINGKMISLGETDQQGINTFNLESGIYFLEIINPDSRLVYKVIKQ